MHSNHYLPLSIMVLLSFISMYVLMYAMVDSMANVYANFNQVYMAALMTAPMIIFELILMRAMYRNAKLNLLILLLSVLMMLGSLLMIRDQTAISDRQFIRSMIPHHAGALLMCDEAPITDPELMELCKSIKRSEERRV